MTSGQFDAAAFKEQQRAAWDATSHGWAGWRSEFERGAAGVTTRLLDLAGVRAGQRVLDVATGHGDPAVSAAEVVGSDGHVVGVDISPGMIETARKRAAGMENIEFIEGDMESVELPAGSFDVVLSRFGLMFATDHLAIFRALRRVLVPGGVLAAAVWGGAEGAEEHLLSLGPAALVEHLELPSPPPGVPTPFAMSDRDRVTDELAAVGFARISVTDHVVPFRFPSVADYVSFNKEVLPPSMLGMIRDKFGSEDDEGTWAAVAAAAEKHVADDGSVPLPSTALLVRAVAPE